jgi:hypothetical protein
MKKLSLKFLFSIMLLGSCLTSAIASQGPWDWVENYGQISQLYPNSAGRYYFKLKNGQTAMNPTRGYYFIPESHANYEASVKLLSLAAEHQWTVQVRTERNLTQRGYAQVKYILVDR